MRIAFLTDLHLGAANESAMWQPFWTPSAEELAEPLIRWVDEHRVEALAFGGDMTHHGCADEIDQLVSAFSRIDRLALVCLGNHDLVDEHSVSNWQHAMSEWPNAQLADADVSFDEIDVLLLNNRWIGPQGAVLRWRDDWETGCAAALTDDQLAWLDECLARNTNRPAILIMHANLHGLSRDLVGEDQPTHDPHPNLPVQVKAVLARHPRCRAVLGGHSHANTVVVRGERWHVTTAAYREAPGAVRLIECHADQLAINTYMLAPPECGVRFDSKLDWVMGTELDRRIVIPLRS